MKKHLLFLLAITSLSGCQKNMDFGPDEGITYRDYNNVPQAKSDPSDWTSDGSWNKQEKKLFDDLGVDVNSTAQGGIREIIFYPNPVTTEATFGYDKTIIPNVSVKYSIVDRKYKVLHNATLPVNSAGRSYVRLDFDDSKFEKGKIYRLYYVFYQNSTLYYKGHGDVKIAD